MKEILRYILRIAGILLCLLFLAWAGLAIYVQLHKRSILDKAQNAFKERLQGDARIGSLDISFFRDFPSITVRLSAVSLRDSAWAQHHHDLLNAQNIYLTCNIWKSLFTRSVQMGKITLEHGQVYFYTDSTGYTNTYLLGKRKTEKPEKAGRPGDLPDIRMTD